VDHDGRKDVFVINGHVYAEIDKINLPSKCRQPRLLYWNVGDGKFVDLSSGSGPGIKEAWSSRGAAVGDLDNDGSLEIVINNLGSHPSLLKNFATARNWLLVRLQGVKCNRDAVGARVFVYAGGGFPGKRRPGRAFSHKTIRVCISGSRMRLLTITSKCSGRAAAGSAFPGGKTNRIVTLREDTGSRI
jgi:hypothetical protein